MVDDDEGGMGGGCRVGESAVDPGKLSELSFAGGGGNVGFILIELSLLANVDEVD